MQIFKNPNFKFMKYKYIALGFSLLIISIGIINITVGNGLKYGIDFAGGTLIRVLFQQETPIQEVRASLENANLGTPKIQEVEKSNREYMIRTQSSVEGEIEKDDLESHEKMGALVVSTLRDPKEADLIAQGLVDLNSIAESEISTILEMAYPERKAEIAKNIWSARTRVKIFTSFEHLKTETGIEDDVISLLKQKTFLSNLTILSKDSVSPQIGSDLRKKTTLAAIWALIGMLIYIGIRFRFAYGVAAIITLAHDVLITIGIFSLTNREINLPVIAAVLTIIGYSLNDTIVIFDRVRDNIKLLRRMKFSDVLDTSINQTLSRTVITSGTTFLTVLSLFLLGGIVINDFAFTIMIGVIIGTYSSIYQSCSILFFWNKFFKPKKGMGK